MINSNYSWAKDEPNNSGNEDCGEISIHKGYKWNDDQCSSKKV